jgi:hypothetical protein
MFRSSKRSIPELLNNPATASDIINKCTVRIALETRLFITPVAEITIDTLTTVLLEFSVQAPSLTPMHIDTICAIAILLFKTDHEQKVTQKNRYKAALLSGLDNNTNDQTIHIAARDTIKARQILINVALNGPVAPKKVSHAQLAEKIQEMFLAIINFDTPDLIIKNVTQYHNGGTIIKMTTAEAANYLKKNDVKEEFIKNLDPKVVFKDRAYLVVIQFVPLTFNPNSENKICKLEQENDWEEGTISMAC